MSKSLHFDEQMAARVEAVYRTRDIVNRRRAVLDALHLEAGDTIADIGSGPGFVAYEMAEQVGPTGRVQGVDISEPMLALARRRCSEQPWVSFEKGDAADLPLPAAGFDVAVSIQVLEYVPDTAKALREMARILRPGGRGVVVCTDWDSMIWHAGDREHMQRVLAAFGEHSAHSDLPRTLGSRLREAGLNLRETHVLPQFNTSFSPDTYGYQISTIIQSFVPGRQGLTREDLSAWVDDLQELDENGAYFFCLNQFLFLFEKPD